MGIGLLASLLFSSCKKSTSPADKDFFIGKYTGHISYAKTGDDAATIDKESGNVEVVKVGDSYNFLFSDGIPDIKNIKFEKKGDNSVVNIGSDDQHYISIDASKLTILYHSEDEIWTADCQR